MPNGIVNSSKSVDVTLCMGQWDTQVEEESVIFSRSQLFLFYDQNMGFLKSSFIRGIHLTEEEEINKRKKKHWGHATTN